MPKQSRPEKIWRWLVNIWMIVTCAVVVVDFFSFGRYSFLLSPLALLYISLLSVYVTSKEFQRWFLSYQGHHPGEIAVFIWTVLIIMMIILNGWLGKEYRISQEVISTYLTIVSIFIVSKGSKVFYRLHSR
jgi:drug/metabolite transporter (DMT)-like permease